MMLGGWKTVKLEELKAPKKHSLVGGPFGSNLVTRDYVDQGVPVIRGTNLSGDFRFSLEDLVFVSEEKANDLLPNNAHPGDVVFTQRGTLGQIGIIPKDCGYDRFVISQSQMKLTVDEDKAEPLYVFYFFKSAEAVQKIHNLAFSSGVPHINLQILREFEISLPPLPVQRKIADVLSTYDDLIEVNTRRIRILEQMAQSMYREWFGKVDMKSPPEGWEQKTLGDIAQEIRRSIQPNEIDPETPYFGLEHLPRKSIALSEWGKASDVKSTKLSFKQGEILFGKIRPYFHKVGVAPLDGVSSTDAIIIAPKDPEYFGITLSYVSSEDFVNHATQTSQGTKMPRANWDVLVKYPVHIPPKDILTKHNEFMRDIVDMIQNLLFANRNLRRTRDLLLPRLVSGEIELKLEE